MTRFSPVVLIALAAFSACEPDPREDVRETSEPAPAAVRPAFDDPSESEQTPEVEGPDQAKPVAFKGAANLPPGHPCHDDAPVLSIEFQPRDGEKIVYVPQKLSDWDADPDAEWTARGPRTVRGYEWKVDGVEYNVATCEMSGNGIGAWDPGPELAAEVGFGPDDAQFEFNRVGEINSVQFSTVVGMVRDKGEEWNIAYRFDRWTNNDEGNNPRFFSRTRLLEAVDSNRDGDVELAGFSLVDCRRAVGFCRQANPGETPRFHLQVFANIDSSRLAQDFEMAGTKVVRASETYHDGIDAERLSLLEPRLEAHKEAALEQARALLREHKKLD